MLIISFGWTTPALFAGRKTVTRRRWAQSHASKFKAGSLAAAYNHLPRIHGHRVAIIRILRQPYLEPASQMPPEDFENEGFQFMLEQGLTIDGIQPHVFWEAWKASSEPLWVVRFQLISRLEQPQ